MKLTIREITLEVLIALGREHNVTDPEDIAEKSIMAGDIGMAWRNPEFDPNAIVPEEQQDDLRERARKYFSERLYGEPSI